MKPGASLRIHHFFAASVWSLVGCFLMVRGGLFLHAAGRLWLIIPAVVVGTVKALLILDKAARKNLLRLSEKEDGDCLGGVYSAQMWSLVVMMMLLGWLLRHSGLPVELIGTLYAAIGWALMFSSRLVWRRAILYDTV